MLSDPLTNFKKQKKYQNELRFNGAHTRNNSPKINYRTYVINLDAYNSKGLTGNLCMLMVIVQHILITLKLNIFQQKLWATKILQQILTEYKHTI